MPADVYFVGGGRLVVVSSRSLLKRSTLMGTRRLESPLRQ